MSPDKAWKRAERMIAADCGGKRIPVTGERHGSDVQHELFDYQLKVRNALPAWLFSWLAGITGTAKRNGRVGVLVLNLPRRPRRGALVVLRWDDWVALHGTPSLPADEKPPLEVFRHWSKDPLVPYEGCVCATCQSPDDGATDPARVGH